MPISQLDPNLIRPDASSGAGTEIHDAIDLMISKINEIVDEVVADISGTANRLAKFTAPTVIGDTAFPIDDAAGSLTLGNSASDVIYTQGIYQKTLEATGGVILRAPSVADPGTGMYSLGIVDADWTTYFDKTLQLGYNYQGANRQNLSEPAVFLQFESKYDAGSGYQTETHLSGISTGGTETRWLSNAAAWDGSFNYTDITSSRFRLQSLAAATLAQMDSNGWNVYTNGSYQTNATNKLAVTNVGSSATYLIVGAYGSAGGTLDIRGTTYGTNFMTGSDEDIYIRGGKAASDIYIGDLNALVSIAAGGAPTTMGGNLTVAGNTTLNGQMTFGDAGTDYITCASDYVTFTSSDAVIRGAGSLYLKPDYNGGGGSLYIGTAAADLIGFHGSAGAAQETVTGSRGGNAALADLLTKLANKGIIVNGTSA